jgi:TetR/AcrR family transcriptional regulator, transcriptional repressor for nem operon
MKTNDMYNQIVKSAENLTQLRGYNAFSYGDIAELIGIKTSSIHYHFPTKADLGKAIVKQHVDMLCSVLEQIVTNKKLSYRKKLAVFLDSIFSVTYRDNKKMCLGGMLAADVLTLPENMQAELRVFFNRLQEWIKRLLNEACESKEFLLTKKDIPNELKTIFSLIEGSILLARVFQDENYLFAAKKQIVARLIKKKSPAASSKRR